MMGGEIGNGGVRVQGMTWQVREQRGGNREWRRDSLPGVRAPEMGGAAPSSPLSFAWRRGRDVCYRFAIISPGRDWSERDADAERRD